MADHPTVPTVPTVPEPSAALAALVRAPGRADRLVCTHVRPAAEAVTAQWPDWVDPAVRSALAGTDRLPWSHQIETAEHAQQGRSVVVSTGTASGKSWGYLIPALTAVIAGVASPTGRAATVLYLAPTKALAHDQLTRIRELGIDDVRAATFDGDTDEEARAWARSHAAYLLTNPDMLHRTMLPAHGRWASFLRALRYVVIDECHVYRGVFGAHVAAVLRRLFRVARRYGANPVAICSSATVADPAAFAGRLTGRPCVAVTADGSPRGRSVLALWEPPLTSLIGESGAPVRRSALAETADLLADLVIDDRRTLAFVRSRRGSEAVATMAREHLEDVSPGLGDSVAAYRGGYLPEERRDLERSLKTGRLRGLATTNALELGVDVSGLDAVVIAGWPGTRASLWQQAGRAGRDGREALAVLVARDDPLDTYLVHHPEAIVGRPVEASVFDPANPYVLGPHLAAAAAELPPLSEADLELFVGTPDSDISSQVVTVRATADALVAADLLRRRAGGWYWTRPERATDLTDLRGIGGGPVRVVEDRTGRLLGTVDRSAADGSVHAGAVYVHQGITHEVMAYDPDEGVSIAVISDVDHTTSARSVTQWNLIEELAGFDLGDVGRVATGIVEVTSQVVSYLMRRLGTGEVIGERPLELPARTLRTRAVWYTLTPEVLERSGIDDIDLPGALHAAEHAAIGLLPLVATCDRWDIGGVSTALHPDTLLPTVVVYDGHPGGAGFAERGFVVIGEWLGATRDAIVACECPNGCPSCVQSPKCGNGNEPLDKAGAVRVLEVVLGHLPG